MPDKLSKIKELSRCSENFSLPQKPAVIVAFGSRTGANQGNEVSKRLGYIARHYGTDPRPPILLTGNEDEAAKMQKELEDMEELQIEVDQDAKNTHDNARWTANKLEQLGKDLSGSVAFIAFPVLAAGGIAALEYQGLTDLHPVFPATCEHINVQDPGLGDGWVDDKIAEKKRNGWAGALNFSEITQQEKDENLKWIFGAEAPGERQLVRGAKVPNDAVQRWGKWMLKRNISRTLCLLCKEELDLYQGASYEHSLTELGLKSVLVDVANDTNAWHKIQEAIKAAVDAKESVVVHCSSGQNRTGCVLGAILKHYVPTLSYEDAEKEVLPKGPVIRKPKASAIQKLMEQGTLKGGY